MGKKNHNAGIRSHRKTRLPGAGTTVRFPFKKEREETEEGKEPAAGVGRSRRPRPLPCDSARLTEAAWEAQGRACRCVTAPSLSPLLCPPLWPQTSAAALYFITRLYGYTAPRRASGSVAEPSFS